MHKYSRCQEGAQSLSIQLYLEADLPGLAIEGAGCQGSPVILVQGMCLVEASCSQQLSN